MEFNDRLIKTKEAWAKARRGETGTREVEGLEAGDGRLPPGQHLVGNWPVLDLGNKPEIPLTEWKLTIGGFVAKPVVWGWQDFLAQPQIRSVSDFHCVTTWSRFETEWEGVSFRRLIEVVRPLSLAKFVLFTSYDDYTTNLPLEACDD
ncbi:MAG: molybdopterin-dependent oxidoreductase, partial [Anaerolineales bacterium]